MGRNIFITLATLFITNYVSAQSISGKVVDENQEPIPYASCVLMNASDSTFVAGAASNLEGVFNFNVPKASYIIQVSYIGYKTKEIVCSSGDIGSIVLDVDTQTLDEVVVKGERPLVKMENNRLTYNIAGILETKIVSNAHELIKELPSVMSLDGNSLSLVGSTSTTICINGKKSQLDISQLTDYLKSLPADEVEKVEVLYNAPPQWHVKGAVINVVLKKKKNYTINGQVQGSYVNQHRNSYDLGGTLMASTPKVDFDVMYKFADQRAISQTDMDGIHTVDDVKYNILSTTKEYEKNNKHSIYTNVGYKINDNNNLDFSYNGLIAPKTTSELYSKNSMFSNALSINLGENYLHNFALSYTSQKGVSVGVEYTNYVNSGTQNMQIFNGDSFQNTFSYFTKQNIDKVKAYVDMSHTLKSNWTINYGVNYNFVKNSNIQENDDLQNSGENDYNKESIIDEHSAIAYVGFQKSFLSGKLSVNASLSGELYKINDYTKNALLPNVGITYMPSYNHIFQIGFNSLRTYPSYWQRQDYTSYSDEYIVNMGNPLLKPARTSNVEFTYVLKQKYIFQASYYRVDDFFVSQSYQMPDELKLLYKSFNIDYTSNLNFTSIIPFSIGKWYNSNFIVSAYNERYKSNDWYGYKYDRDKWTGMFMLNNTFNISQKPKLSANLMLFYRTPTIQGIWDLGSNWCVNAGIKYSFLKDNAILSLQCNDIFESMYPKIKVRFENQYQDINSSAYSRNITLSFTYKFKGYKNKTRKEVDTSRFGIQ